MIVTPLFVPAAATATSWLSSAPHPLAFSPQQQQHEVVGGRKPLHAASSSTSLTAFKSNGNSDSAPHPSTQLQYKTVVDSYLEEVNVGGLSFDLPHTNRLLNGKDWSMLQQFRVIRETATVCYPHLVDTQATWGSTMDQERRNKFVPLLSPVQHESFEAMFRLVDRNEDGQISIKCLREVLDTARLDEEPAQQDISNASSQLSLNEFMGIAAEAEFYKLLLETFGGMDHKNSGYIQVDQVSAMLQELTLALYNPEFDSDEIMTENACTTMINEMIEHSENGTEMVFNYEDFTKSLLGMRC